MKGYMLDTTFFNKVADGSISVEAFSGLDLFATHIQLDELQNTKSDARRAELLRRFAKISPVFFAEAHVVMPAPIESTLLAQLVRKGTYHFCLRHESFSPYIL